MVSLQLDLPDSVLLATGQSRDEFSREAKFLLALKLFEVGRLSSGVPPSCAHCHGSSSCSAPAA